MIVAFDANVLVYLVTTNANPPIDPSTDKPLVGCKERVENLIETLQHANAKIVIPTPALAEVLVRAAGAAPDFLKLLGSSKHFRVVSFDERAAVEFAAMQAARVRTQKNIGPRWKPKFDDQIIAIASVEGARVIYSDDSDIRKAATPRFEVKGILDLPLPDETAQVSFPFQEISDNEGDSW